MNIGQQTLGEQVENWSPQSLNGKRALDMSQLKLAYPRDIMFHMEYLCSFVCPELASQPLPEDDGTPEALVQQSVFLAAREIAEYMTEHPFAKVYDSPTPIVHADSPQWVSDDIATGAVPV